MVRAASGATTGGGEPEGKRRSSAYAACGHGTGLCRISQDKIRNRYKISKDEIFPGGRLQGGKSGESYPQGGGWLGSVHEERAVEGIDFMKKKIFGAALGMIKWNHRWVFQPGRVLGLERPTTRWGPIHAVVISNRHIFLSL